MMKLVCTISSTTTRSMVHLPAGPGGPVTISKIVYLATTTAVATHATGGTATMIVTMTQFAEFGMKENTITSTILSVLTLKNATPLAQTSMQTNYPKDRIASGSATITRILTESMKFAGTLVIQSSPVQLMFMETK